MSWRYKALQGAAKNKSAVKHRAFDYKPGSLVAPSPSLSERVRKDFRTSHKSMIFSRRMMPPSVSSMMRAPVDHLAIIFDMASEMKAPPNAA